MKSKRRLVAGPLHGQRESISLNSDRKYAWLLVGVIVGLSAVRALFCAWMDLSPDEAYYWTWSGRLAFGYYDHPPMVALLIRMGTFVFGPTALGVRLGALVCAGLTTWIVFLIARRIVDNVAYAFWSTLLVAVAPILSVGAVVHTPDAALMLFWSLTVYISLDAYHQNRLRDWIFLGVVVGLACLSKGNGFLLPVGLGLFSVGCKTGRDSLRGTGPVLCVMVALVVLLPNLLWNAQHAGGSFLFQLKHATGDLHFNPLGLLELIGAQVGLLGPLLFLACMVFVLVGYRRAVRFGRSRAFLLWCLSAPLLLGLAALSLFHKVEANWPAMGYIAAVPGSLWVFTGGFFYVRRRVFWVMTTLASGFLLSFLIHLQAVIPFLPLAPDPTERRRGWSELSAQAVLLADEWDAALASEGYGPVSELMFYTGRPVIYEASSTRDSQFGMGLAQTFRDPQRILFVQPRSTKTPPVLCAPGRKRELVPEDPQGSQTRNFRFWLCESQGFVN
jgi:4-amino-4-deoxy-L-arabinose transferase-like glycosyltransferase